MQDDPNIENEELVNDEVAQQLASLQAIKPATPQPGQQLQPDPDAPDPVATTTTFSDVGDTPKPYVPPTPDPAPEEPAVVQPLEEPEVAEESEVTEEPGVAEEPVVPTPAPVDDDADSAVSSTSDDKDSQLSTIKKQALEELSPLVDKLDLAPEKRYDVIMEMIQASNDEGLVQKAFDAAHEIADDDLRAQALLEVVNEIDYLTKPSE